MYLYTTQNLYEHHRNPVRKGVRKSVRKGVRKGARKHQAGHVMIVPLCSAPSFLSS